MRTIDVILESNYYLILTDLCMHFYSIFERKRIRQCFYATLEAQTDRTARAVSVNPIFSNY